MLEVMFGIELLPTLSLNLKSPVATKFGTVFTRGAVQSQKTEKKTYYWRRSNIEQNKTSHVLPTESPRYCCPQDPVRYQETIKNLNPPTIPAVATVDEERGEETEEKPKATKRKPTKRKASKSLGKRKQQRLFPRKTRVIRLIRIRSLMGQVVRVMMPFWHRLLKGIAPSSGLCHAACGPLLPAMENILHCVPRLRT